MKQPKDYEPDPMSEMYADMRRVRRTRIMWGAVVGAGVIIALTLLHILDA